MGEDRAGEALERESPRLAGRLDVDEGARREEDLAALAMHDRSVRRPE